MILSVLMLGGLLLSATAIAGFLTRYQIRQISDVENSAKAFFAADAGQEWVTYCFWKNPSYFNDAQNIADHPCKPEGDPADQFKLTFETAGVAASSSAIVTSGVASIVSQGTSGRAIRLLEILFTQ